jgi:sarcosine oxidase subunit gamma
VISTATEGPALHRLLAEGLQGSSCRATTLSSGLVRIEVEGSNVRELLAKGCGLDLRPESFGPNRCARTRFAEMPVVLAHIRDDAFWCIVSASYADYLLALLADAAQEFSAPGA